MHVCHIQMLSAYTVCALHMQMETKKKKRKIEVNNNSDLVFLETTAKPNDANNDHPITDMDVVDDYSP